MITLVAAAFALAAAAPDFTRDVKPIFDKSCANCHGAKLQMGGLRLDSRQVAAKSIVAGKSAESSLYQRVAGIGDQPRMPMGGKPLSGAEIAILKSWIDAGAPWPESADGASARVKKHWAYSAPVRPPVPQVKNRAWVRNPIDAFVLARLEKEGLQPSSEADAITLARRMSLDVIGLPPGDKLLDVEGLLASPHYGERWARHWLDAARYADSDGFEKDKSRQVWFYRDWVINAFNRDLPYDRFVIEQIAGDLLPNATQDQMVATGFLRNSMINEEGGIDPEQFRMEAMFDRMDAIGKGILGVTIQCAQCHNHKFDPLSQEEYYKLFAFINNTDEANIAVYTPEEERKRQNFLKRIGSFKPEQPRITGRWTVVKPEVDDISTGGQRYLPLEDGSLLAAGYAPTKHKVKLTLKTEMKGIRAIRLELLNDPNLPLGGPGRSIKGTGALTEFEVEKVKVASATADLELPETQIDAIYDDKSGRKRVTGPIAFALDGKEETAWGHDAGPVLRNQPRVAVFNLAEPLDGTVVVHLSQRHGGWNSDDNQNYNLGRIRLSVSTDEGARVEPVKIDTKLWSEHPEGSTQLVLHEREQRRPTHILSRGDYLKPTKEVQPGVPSFLHPLPESAEPDRLRFARWLVDRRSPTTARSIVNRVWQAYFGTGLVETAEDLGMQSAAPSHPELLDWLAVEFMDKGWSLKHLHRLILNSATYRQSSKVTPELLSRDPYNRLLARGTRMRVEGEVVRDIALAASGLLNPKIGGPSVFPLAPEFLFLPPSSYGPKNWPEEKGDDRYRRALYTFRFRSVPYPMLQTFDTPNGDTACVRRPKSNTPLQALVTLNEPLFLEAARGLAFQTLAHGGSTDSDRIEYAFRRVLTRRPTAAEQAELLGFLAKQSARIKDGWISAPDLADLKQNVAKLPSGTTPAQAAAWTALSRVLLNLDEAITKE